MKPFRFPSFETRELANGMRALVARYDRGPLVHVLLVFPGGGQSDPPGSAGLATLTAALMDEGTQQRSALEIAERVEDLGGYLSTQADWDSLGASIGVMAPDLERALGLLAEVTSGATYPESELTRLRSQQLAELQRRLAQPAALAIDALIDALYRGTVYGVPLLGTSDTVAAIDRPRVVEFAHSQVTPSGATIIVVGDLDVGAATSAIEDAFGAWSGVAAPAPPRIEPPRLEGIEVRLVDRPGAAQTEIRLGHVGAPRSEPDMAGLKVLNTLLGGKFTSRINLNLREHLGITYGASSNFAQRRGPGPFVIGASVDTHATVRAVEEILGEMRRCREETVSQEELDDTKSYLLGVFPYTLQEIEGLASRLAELAVYDLPLDHFDRFLRQLAEVTTDDLQRLARRWLNPDRIAVVAVGPKAELEDQLSPLGEIRNGTAGDRLGDPLRQA